VCIRSFASTSQTLHVTQAVHCWNHSKLYLMAGGQPHSSWAISLPELIFTVLQRNQPGIWLTDSDVISSSDPWHAMMICCVYEMNGKYHQWLLSTVELTYYASWFPWICFHRCRRFCCRCSWHRCRLLGWFCCRCSSREPSATNRTRTQMWTGCITRRHFLRLVRDEPDSCTHCYKR